MSGDMADYINETSQNAIEDGYLSEREDGDGPPICYKTCRCCGQNLLMWSPGKIDGKYRLGTYGWQNKFVIHKCPVNPLKT